MVEAQSANSIDTQLQGSEGDFYKFHGAQLFGMNFPGDANLIKQLHHKLEKCEFDAGDYFEVIVNEQTESFEVIAKRDITAGQDVFLVDHAFSFRYPELRTALTQNQHVKDRLSSMLTFADTKRPHPQYPKKPQENKNIPIFEYDSQDIEDPSSLEVPENAVGLSLWGNNISEFEKLRTTLDKLKNLRVLWLNENPIAENFAELLKQIETHYPTIQILNSRFTLNVNTWGVKFANYYPNLEGFDSVEIQDFKALDLSSRNIFHLEDFSLFSEFKNVKNVNLKSHEIETFDDTNKLISFLKTISRLENIDCEGQIYDILWEFHKNNKLVGLFPSLKFLNSYDLLEGKPSEDEADIRSIIKNIWKIAGTYRLATSEQLDETNVWYVLDEFGSAIQRSTNSNAMVKPFLYAPENIFNSNVISYSLLWFTKDVKAGESVLQDYLEGGKTAEEFLAQSKVWFDTDNQKFLDAFAKRKERLAKATKEAQEDVNVKKTENISSEKPQHKLPLKVATNYELVIEKLTSKNYEIVKGVDDADIVWLISSLNDSEILKNVEDGKFVNQFPSEASICMKHFLAKTIYQGAGNVKWLQPTYDLLTDLDEFVGDFITREKNHYDNHWIIKAPNLARSLDMVITDNLDTILRMMETGPRIAQKYIHKPLKLRNKKIDHRFIVLVKSIQPLEVFIYKTFMTRTSNNKFTLDPRSIDNFETHFTIMTYSGRKQDEIAPEWFLETFDQAHKDKNISWDLTYGRIKDMVKEIFTAVNRAHPEMHNKNCRAIYGMDVMIDEDYQPKLLELTFAPDCKRPSTLNPEFWNDIFDCFFLGEERNVDRVF